MSASHTVVFRFAAFCLDPARRLLTRDGRPVALTPKEFDTLLALVEAEGAVVRKEELISRVWPDSYVGDGSLARNISVLRRVLGEEVVATLPKRGYRITLPIASGEPAVVEPVKVAVVPADPPATVPAARPKRRWLAASAIAAALAITLGTSRFVLVKSARAGHVSSIQSIHLRKEGALDPPNEGFKIYQEDGHYPHALYNRETNGWDRYRLRTNDQNYYYRALSTEEKDFALQRDWTLTCVCAVEQGGGFADIDFGGKGPRFDIELLQEGDRYFVALTRQISPRIELDQKIEFPGVADVDHPHTYELRYDHVTQTASLWIDGNRMASGYRGHHQFQEDRGLIFGAAIYYGAPVSSIVFRTVRFDAE